MQPPFAAALSFAEGETAARIYDAGVDAPRFVFAHGAGAGQQSAAMVRWAEGLSARGITVVTFDFVYMATQKKLPDKPPLLEACFRAVIAAHGGARPVIGGRSMGGRMASHLAAAQEPASVLGGLVMLGYPLHPPKQPDKLRVEHLPRVVCPTLVVQGERDEFGSPSELHPFFAPLPAATIRAVPNANHSLEVRPKRAQNEVDAALFDEVAAFVRRHGATAGGESA